MSWFGFGFTFPLFVWLNSGDISRRTCAESLGLLLTDPDPSRKSLLYRMTVQSSCASRRRREDGRFIRSPSALPFRRSIVGRNWSERLTTQLKILHEEFLNVLFIKGDSCDWIPAGHKNGPLVDAYRAIIQPKFQLTGGLFVESTRQYHRGCESRERLGLRKRRVTDPQTNYTNRIHVFEGWRLPSPQRQVQEVQPICVFLGILHESGKLTCETVDEAGAMLIRLLQRYWLVNEDKRREIPILPKVYGYDNFPPQKSSCQHTFR